VRTDAPKGGVDVSDANALVGEVLAGATFYSVAAPKKTGTLALTGDAVVTDVKVGKKFYKDDPASQLTGTLDQSDATAAAGDIVNTKTAYANFVKLTGTNTNPDVSADTAVVGDVVATKTFHAGADPAQKTGTLALTGDAVVGDVVSGKKFYKDDPASQLTGTLAISDSAAVGDVISGKTFHNTSLTAQRTGTLALTGDAVVGDVALGKTFYKDDPTSKLTGTLVATVLTGDAVVGDVVTGKTFYKDDPASKLTGTLALTGDAAVGDVKVGKKFYKDDPTSKLTGTLALTGDAVVANVLAGKLFYKDDPATKLTGTGDLVEHQNAENTLKPNDASTNVGYHTLGVPPETILSASITTTVRCALVVVATTVNDNGTQYSDIKRGGVTKTIETTISSTDANYFRVHVQYAVEILAAGTYQYDLIGNTQYVSYCGATIKIVAVKFG
jgi:hypothetical protein